MRTQDYEGVKHEIHLEELRLSAIEDRLRRLELERSAGEIRTAITALAGTRESLEAQAG